MTTATVDPTIKRTEEEVVITVEKAKELLALNEDNRPLSELYVRYVANAIKAGNWKYTGDTIKISNKNILMDGQHRLYACIEADTPIVSDIKYGLDPESFDVMDIGRKRTLADTLKKKQIPNFRIMSKLTKYHWQYTKYGNKFGACQMLSPTNVEGLRHYEMNSDSFQNTYEEMKMYKGQRRLISFENILFTYEILKTVDKKDALLFLERLIIGSHLERKSPTLALRNLLIETSTLDLKRTNATFVYFILDAIVRAWNQERDFVKVDRFMFKKTLKQFPYIK